MAQQTTVEWLFETMAKTPMTEWYQVLEQAKEMHKEETMDAFQAGKWDGYENKVCGANQFKDPAEYYNETFNK